MYSSSTWSLKMSVACDQHEYEKETCAGKSDKKTSARETSDASTIAKCSRSEKSYQHLNVISIDCANTALLAYKCMYYHCILRPVEI